MHAAPHLMADTATISVDELRTLEAAVFRLVDAELVARRVYEEHGGQGVPCVRERLRDNIAELVEDLVATAITRTHAGGR